MIRAYQPSDLSAVLTLINYDQIPFQPFVQEDALVRALKGEADIDAGWWDDLQSIEVIVCVEKELVVGVAAYGLHKTESTGYILWLHAHEQSTIITKLVKFMVQQMEAYDTLYAFWFATPLTWGIEGLPKKHHPKTHQALINQGFAGEDMWLYMAGSTRTSKDYVGVVKQDGKGFVINITDEASEEKKLMAQADFSMGDQDLGALWWIEVEEAYKGRKLGKRLFHQVLHILAESGAHSMILYVDHDDPIERDRRAAIHMYQGAGFVEIDHLWSYQRKNTRG